MLINALKLINCPVLSLHTGAPIGQVESLVVDPNDLRIIALQVAGPLIRGEVGNLLQINSVREFSNIGLIVDSIDELVLQSDVVKLDEIIKLNFNLIGLKVQSKKGSKIGRVIDYTVNADDFMVMQLIVRRPVVKALVDPELIIARSQITEIDDYKIIVKDEEAKIKKDARKKDFVPNFVNPFREPSFSPAHKKNLDAPDTE